jgi:NADH:ubiquinone oxidoreductase subunit E
MHDELTGSEKQGPENLLAALHEVQAREGFISRHEAFGLSKQLGVPLARVFEVLTFYSFFRLEKPGKVLIAVCLGTSCHLQGGQLVLEAFERELGITVGNATADGYFHLDSVRCLGCCGRSPVIRIGTRIYSQVEIADVPTILNAYRKHEDGAPLRQ